MCIVKCKVTARKYNDGIAKYYIHYNGWGVKYDEWKESKDLTLNPPKEAIVINNLFQSLFFFCFFVCVLFFRRLLKKQKKTR